METVSPVGEGGEIPRISHERTRWRERRIPARRCVGARRSTGVPGGSSRRRRSRAGLQVRASCFATTRCSLEEVALGFMERNARGALKRYLCAKLRQTGVSQRAQRTLLGTWLTEIYLDEINGMSVRKRGEFHQSSTDAEEEAKQASILGVPVSS